MNIKNTVKYEEQDIEFQSINVLHQKAPITKHFNQPAIRQCHILLKSLMLKTVFSDNQYNIAMLSVCNC